MYKFARKPYDNELSIIHAVILVRDDHCKMKSQVLLVVSNIVLEKYLQHKLLSFTNFLYLANYLYSAGRHWWSVCTQLNEMKYFLYNAGTMTFL